jgi:predicted membrane metal-binding protein
MKTLVAILYPLVVGPWYALFWVFGLLCYLCWSGFKDGFNYLEGPAGKKFERWLSITGRGTNAQSIAYKRTVTQRLPHRAEDQDQRQVSQGVAAQQGQ